MTDGEQAASADADACACKLGRTAEKYEIHDRDSLLLDHRAEGASLRRLETVFNEAVLRAAVLETGFELIGDPASVYQRLAGDDASAGERTETASRLRRAGVDPDELTGDFVSYQTVRTHLRECLGVGTDRDRSLSVADAEGTIEWARSRSGGIVERTIERLRDTEGFRVGAVEVSHAIRVSCAECGESHPVERYLDRGGCGCEPDR